jgi:hypothetical protein
MTTQCDFHIGSVIGDVLHDLSEFILHSALPPLLIFYPDGWMCLSRLRARQFQSRNVGHEPVRA